MGAICGDGMPFQSIAQAVLSLMPINIFAGKVGSKVGLHIRRKIFVSSKAVLSVACANVSLGGRETRTEIPQLNSQKIPFKLEVENYPDPVDDEALESEIYSTVLLDDQQSQRRRINQLAEIIFTPFGPTARRQKRPQPGH